MIRLSARRIGCIFVLCLTAVVVGRAVRGANPPSPPPVLVLQRGHRDDIEALAFSPDSRLIATVGGDGTAKVWQTSTGEILTSFLVPFSNDPVLFFVLDNRTLIADGSRDRLDFRDAYTGRIVRSISVPEDDHAIAFSPVGSILAYSGKKGSVALYDWRTGRKRRPLTTHFGNWVTRILFSGNGRMLACADGSSHAIEIWDVQTGRRIQTLEQLGSSWGYMEPVAISPDGRILAVSGEMDPAKGSSVDLWDVESGKRLRTVRGDTSFNTTLSFSADGTTLNVEGLRNGIKSYNVETGDLKSAARGNPLTPSDGISPDGRLEADADDNGTLQLSDVKTGRVHWSVPGDAHEINRLVWPLHNDTLITTGGIFDEDRAEAAFWDARTGACIRRVKIPVNSIREMAVTLDSETLIAKSDYGPISLWNLQTGQSMGTIGDKDITGSAIAVSPDGHTLAIGRFPPRNSPTKSDGSSGSTPAPGRIELWDLGTRKKILSFGDVQRNLINNLAFSPDGTILYSTDEGYSGIVAWSTANGALLHTFLESSPGTGWHLAVSPDGNWVADGGDGPVKVWNAHTGALFRTLDQRGLRPRGTIYAMTFSPDSRRLATCGEGFAHLWDLRTGKPTRVLKGDGLVQSVAFSPHGEMLATTDVDNTIKWWDMRTGKLKAQSALLGPGNGNAPDWITYTPTGSYAGSDSAETYIRWRVGDTLLPASRFHNRIGAGGLLK